MARDFETRRDFLRTVGMGAAGLALAGVAPRAHAAAKHPNIVYILADDMGYGDLGCYNAGSKIPTPHMDRIAREGMRFTDAHSPSAVCTPTRYGILTGRYCWRTDLKAGVVWGYSKNLIDPERLTVGKLLQAHGYHTGGVGKWHLGLGGDPEADYSKPFALSPISHGFDYYFGIPASLDMKPYCYIENDRPTQEPTLHHAGSERGKGGFWRAGPISPDFKHEEVLPTFAAKAVSFIEEHAKATPDKPFFLYFPLSAPHAPWLPIASAKGRSKVGDYGDFVVQVDDTVGRVLEALDKHGLADNTLLVLTSDNGADKRYIRPEYQHSVNHYLRGQKSDVWDGGHRVPFIVRWPGKVQPGSTSGAIVCLSDLMATCADLLGAALPDDAGEDSFSILPALLGEKRDAPIRPATVHHSIYGAFAIRVGRWKLVLGKGSGGWTEGEGPEAGQLYDVESDVSERNNLYEKRPDIVVQLTALLEKYQREGRSRPRSQ